MWKKVGVPYIYIYIYISEEFTLDYPPHTHPSRLPPDFLELYEYVYTLFFM